MQNISVHTAGSNACILLIEVGHEKQLVRVTRSHSKEKTARVHDMHTKLQTQLPLFIPRLYDVREYLVNQLPRAILDAMERYEKCMHMLRRWQRDPDTIIVTYRMEYMPLGSLFGRQHEITPAMLRNIAFQLLVFFYLAQKLYGFEHGDFHAANVLLKRDDMMSATPLVIDFDFASFHTNRNPPRQLGAPWVQPPEAVGRINRNFVLGATDIWSLGLLLLSFMLGKRGISVVGSDNDEAPDITAERMHCLQRMLDVVDAPPPAVQHTTLNAKMTHRFKERIDALPKEARVLLRTMFRNDPRERVFHGHLLHYLDMEYFRDVPDREGYLQRVVVFSKSRTRQTTSTFDFAAQLENLIQAQLVMTTPVCAACGNDKLETLSVCADYGVVVCGEACWHAAH